MRCKLLWLLYDLSLKVDLFFLNLHQDHQHRFQMQKVERRYFLEKNVRLRRKSENN